MNIKQREIIIDALIQHKNNGFNGDIAGAYNDINDFFNEIINTDDKLQKEASIAIEDWNIE